MMHEREHEHEREEDEAAQGLPNGLTGDIASLAAVMAEHGLEKIQVTANGVRIVLTAPRAPKATEVVTTRTLTSEASETVELSANGVIAGYAIPAPMIGTYSSSPSPTEEPFVRVGDLVSAGQTVAIIEAMKIMNEIQAERSGVLEELLVSNGQPVEYNQPLMRLA